MLTKSSVCDTCSSSARRREHVRSSCAKYVSKMSSKSCWGQKALLSRVPCRPRRHEHGRRACTSASSSRRSSSPASDMAVDPKESRRLIGVSTPLRTGPPPPPPPPPPRGMPGAGPNTGLPPPRKRGPGVAPPVGVVIPLPIVLPAAPPLLPALPPLPLRRRAACELASGGMPPGDAPPPEERPWPGRSRSDVA